MQPELTPSASYSTKVVYWALKRLGEAGFKIKLQSITSNYPLIAWYQFDYDKSYEIAFKFQIVDTRNGPIHPRTYRPPDALQMGFSVDVIDLDIDWEFINDAVGCEVMNVAEWNSVYKDTK